MHEPGIGDEEEGAQPLRGPLGQGLYTLCKAFAIGGGLLFVLLVLMSLISIVGRKLASMPIPGDIEIMQMGTAVASAAMLAYCEMMRHHLMLLLPVWPAVALLVPSFVLLAAAGFYNMSHHWKLSVQNEVTV